MSTEETALTEQPGESDKPSGQPRPFFADEPDQAPDRGDPGQTGRSGQTGLPGSPYGQPGSLPTGWPPANQLQQQPTSQQQPTQRQPPRGQPPRGQPLQRQPAQRSGRPPERELRQRAVAALAFGAIALIALLGLGTDLHKGVYVLIFSAAVGVAAIVIGISALVKARRSGSYRPRFAVGGIVLGALATLISVPILATYLAFPTQVNNYVNCLRQAQNSSDQRACMSKFYKDIHIGATAGTTGPAAAAGSPAQLPTYQGR